MKATLTTTFNETQLKQILNSLTVADCKRAATFLQKRIQLSAEQQQLKNKGVRKLDEEFLNTCIKELGLQTLIVRRLKEAELYTVRDITDLGIEKLTLLRGIGERTAQEIKREIFNSAS